ncbi:hypothetical protein [Empedobacter sp.]|uniref:hypothetical protein n=1 Tax=Empedobacter sp. TaxID=1927715 RepID=UPI0028AE65EF|nr:hypothetical protein [Empedobacter sp.]
MNTIENLLKLISSQNKRDIKKLEIRELEEEKKGNFIAFVDDQSNSYDVNIVIKNKEVTSHSCDCGSNESWCIHQKKMLEEIVKLTSLKPVKKTRIKKEKESETLLKLIEEEDLRKWLLDFFNTNREAEQYFMLSFSQKQKEYSLDEVEQLIKDTITSIIGKKRKVEISEVKKIIDLLQIALEPVFAYIDCIIKTTEIVKPLIIRICDLLLSFHFNSGTTSKRLEKYVYAIIEKYAFRINKIAVEEQWKNVVLDHWSNFLNMDNITVNDFEINKEIYYQATTERKKIIGQHLLNYLKKWHKENINYNIEIQTFFLQIMIETELFTEIKDYFKPSIYQNDYNLMILEELMKTNHIAVEAYCKDIISNNSKEKYNYPYYNILEKLYKQTNDLPKYTEIKLLKFPYNPSLEDFLFIKNHLNEEEKFKKFRTKTLTNLKINFYESDDCIDLYFKILDAEKEYKKMIDVISNYVPAEIILCYFDQLFLFNKNTFLINLLKRLAYLYSYSSQKDMELDLINKIKKSYGDILIKKYLDFLINSDNFIKIRIQNNEFIEKLLD